MKINRFNPSTSENTGRSSAFSLVELLVIVAMVILLASLQIAASGNVKDRSHIAHCSSNLKQFALAHHIYGGENNDRLPSASTGFWIWDMPLAFGTFVESTGAKWQTMYCPGTSVRFSEQDNLSLYNFSGAGRVVGYSLTMPGNPYLNSTNANATLTPARISFGPGILPPPPASQRVLLADATISAVGQDNRALYQTYNFTQIQGAYAKAHLSPHLEGTVPAGGNVAMLDGHVEWRDFQKMEPRTATGAPIPVFWW